jgi:hypothetical protein
LGEPALEIEEFQLWIHGRQFPEAEDYWDGNWLRATAHCGSSGASVWVHGSIVMVTNIVGLGHQCAAMHRRESSSAELAPIEPELKVSLEAADRIGHIRVRVELTPDHLWQFHRFEFKIDQSYLPSIIKQCTLIEQGYPIRGATGREGH